MFEFLKRETGKTIHVNDIDQYLGNIDLIDIREPYEYQRGCLKTARNVPMGDLLKEPDRYLNREKTCYIMCQSGARSARTCSMLLKQGYDVVNVAGGFGSYVGSRLK